MIAATHAGRQIFTKEGIMAKEAKLTPILLKFPADWIEAIDAERGNVPRAEWIRERLRRCGALKPYGLTQPPRRGTYARKQ